MELVEGKTLRSIVAEGPGWEVVVGLGRQIVKALAAAHAAGIVWGGPHYAELRIAGSTSLLALNREL